MLDVFSAARLRRLVNEWPARCCRTAVELGVPDLVGDEPVPLTELAADCGADADSLRRVLRYLASEGVFAIDGDDRVGHTQLSRLLSRDSGEPYADELLHPLLTGTALDLTWTVRTGEPAYERATGKKAWDHISADTSVGGAFHRMMRAQSRLLLEPAIHVCDWSRSQVVVDVGGGSGHLLAALLSGNPHLRGALVDVDAAIATAPPVFEAAGVLDRVELVAGDAVAKVPPADTYLLARVLHDWDDSDATGFLASVAAAIEPGGRLLVIEMIVPEDGRPNWSLWCDIGLMTIFGGRERSLAEWRSLLARSGFDITTVADVPPTPMSVMEALWS